MVLRIWFFTLALVAVAVAALAVVALTEWPQAQLRPADDALARVSIASYGGHVSKVVVSGANGARYPVSVRAERLWPSGKIAQGESLQISVTVTRPSWAAWLVGAHSTRTFTVVTPRATLRGNWLQVAPDAAVTVGYDAPVSIVSLDGHPAEGLAAPVALVPVGVFASGSHAAGSVEIAAAPRLWETLTVPTRVSWFPALASPQVLAAPSAGSIIAPQTKLTLTFSKPIGGVLGTALPTLSPAVAGQWQQTDAHTLTFQPSGAGFPLGRSVEVTLPRAVVIAGSGSASPTRTIAWQVPVGSTMRLQELLADLGYLPVVWHPRGSALPRTARAQLMAALTAPAGTFTWRYANTPDSLKSLWAAGQPNTITQGAVMMFEHNNDLTVDGIAGPEVWNAIIDDVVAGSHRVSGYDYVYVHRTVPQSLNLWVDGKTILSSPGNTGVPAAPTTLGTFAVFEHIPIGTMKGVNPDGTHYDDPNIRWISYFHHGEAIHTFNRASYGTPQSLGCVELPLAAAAKVWPYTPIGTLVTIEN